MFIKENIRGLLPCVFYTWMMLCISHMVEMGWSSWFSNDQLFILSPLIGKKKKIKHFLACTFLNFDHFIGVLNQNRPIKRKRKKILWKKPIPHKEPNSRLLLPGSWPLHNIFFSSYSVFFFWQWWKKEVKPKTPCLKSKCDGQENSYGSPNQFHQQDDLVGKPHIEYPKG